MAAASSLGMPSLIGLGAPSTRSLASLRPKAVISRTTLMTLILLPPTSVSVTVNSVFSSAGAAAAAPPPCGIAIGIAADTPSSDSSVFTSCESSRTLIPLMYSTTCCCVTSAIVYYSSHVGHGFSRAISRHRSSGALRVCVYALRLLAFLLVLRQHIHQIARDGV